MSHATETIENASGTSAALHADAGGAWMQVPINGRAVARHIARWMVSGIVISAVQAWVVSQAWPTRETERIIPTNGPNPAAYHAAIGPPVQSLTSYAARGAVESPAGPVPRTCLYSDSYGWPFKAFTLIYAQDMTAPGVYSGYRLWAGIPLAGSRPHSHVQLTRALPIVPVPGLIANAILFGFPGYFAWTGAMKLKARVRLKHGFCPSCRYPLSEARRCPECGRSHA